MNTTEARGDQRRLRPRIWIGLVAIAIYLLFAALLGNVLGGLAAPGDATAEFALSHLIPLPIIILLGIAFVRWAGWWTPIWRETPTVRMTPRRWWLIAIPVLMTVLPLAQLPSIPWADRALDFILIAAVGTLLVGLGEELFVRGILLVSVRERHRETVTMLVTALVFSFAHLFSSLWHGVPFAAIAFQLAVLLMNGILYYWVRRVTGRLWVGVLVHALTDFVLYVGSGAGNPSETSQTALDPSNALLVVPQLLLIVAAAASVVSVIREDHRARTAA